SRISVLGDAKAEPSRQVAGAKTLELIHHPSVTAALNGARLPSTSLKSGGSAAGSCCSAGATKSRLVALGNVNAKLASYQTEGKKPNILFIMGDDVGWFNIGAYHRGMMSGKTPNLDKLAAEGMLFTDYYAEASCTAGRANFITGEIPLRTGMTTV